MLDAVKNIVGTTTVDSVIKTFTNAIVSLETLQVKHSEKAEKAQEEYKLNSAEAARAEAIKKKLQDLISVSP